MNKRLAKKIMSACHRVGWRKTSYSITQVTHARQRLCHMITIPVTPRGWMLPCWLRAHGIDPVRITGFDEIDGRFLVEWWVCGVSGTECPVHIGEPHQPILQPEVA